MPKDSTSLPHPVPAARAELDRGIAGLGLSVQFVSHRLSESVLCRIGHAYEQATQWHTKHPAA